MKRPVKKLTIFHMPSKVSYGKPLEDLPRESPYNTFTPPPNPQKTLKPPTERPLKYPNNPTKPEKKKQNERKKIENP